MNFLELPEDRRRLAIDECATRQKIAPVIVEKEFWVCWMLDVLFQSSFADSLVFKGGTSLSKVFGAINRFSEDIDLSVSTEFLELPEPGESRNQANKWMTNAEAACTEAALETSFYQSWSKGDRRAAGTAEGTTGSRVAYNSWSKPHPTRQ